MPRRSYDTTLDYFINVSTSCSQRSWPVGVQLEVGLFASLCQYFSESEKQWRTDGMVPLAETTASRAVCRTKHLTAFAAGLFTPPNAISFKAPVSTIENKNDITSCARAACYHTHTDPVSPLAQERAGTPSHIVLLVCVMGLLIYIVAAAVLHKLDQLDLRRAGVVPLCGEDGLFKYEIQVKTGWSRGAGESG